MSQETLFRDIQLTSEDIEVRKIEVKDLWHSIKQGYDDFNSKPTIVVFLFAFYPLFALLLTLYLIGQNLIHFTFPMVSGFTVLGPVILISLFEMSRHREKGQEVSWRTSFDFVHSSSFAPITALTIVMLLLYLAWLYMAQLIYSGTIGVAQPGTISEFFYQVFTTRSGGALIFYGNLVGLVFAVFALSISVVSFPLALDKPVNSITAVTTSIKAVLNNPFVMIIWGLIVTVLLVVGAALFLVGLAVVLPILGHSTWHLYRKLIVP